MTFGEVKRKTVILLDHGFPTTNLTSAHIIYEKVWSAILLFLHNIVLAAFDVEAVGVFVEVNDKAFVFEFLGNRFCHLNRAFAKGGMNEASGAKFCKVNERV